MSVSVLLFLCNIKGESFPLFLSLKKTDLQNSKIIGKHQKESQKAVMIDVMKYVGEIASNIWPAVQFFIPFLENLTLIRYLDIRSRSSALGSLNALYLVVSWH